MPAALHPSPPFRRQAMQLETQLQRVCDGCFQAAQSPAAQTTSLASTSLVLHVAGAVSARDLTAAFAERRARHNAGMRERTQRVADALNACRSALACAAS